MTSGPIDRTLGIPGSDKNYRLVSQANHLNAYYTGGKRSREAYIILEPFGGQWASIIEMPLLLLLPPTKNTLIFNHFALAPPQSM